MSDAASKKVNELKAPMPGMIVGISVQPGDVISKGDSLLILEAMKMENILKAPGMPMKTIRSERRPGRKRAGTGRICLAGFYGYGSSSTPAVVF